MKRFNKILIGILIIAMVISIIFVFKKRSKSGNESVNTANNSKGMEVTMLGGSNMKGKGDVNSCGYVIRSANNELIIVDGGRDIDSDLVLEYINSYGNGTVNHWYITHPHNDHIGALMEILEGDNSITIENLYYSFNELEWYRQYDKRGFPTEAKIFSLLDNEKIKNKVECKKNQLIKMDNIDCEIIRGANPEIINSDNGNDSSMVFKMTATDVDKSMLFLGDVYTYGSLELLETPEKLKSYAVQMAHHGQYGASKEVYEAIQPEICFFNAPEWLYNNDNGNGYNSGKWQSIIVQSWMEEMGTTNFLAFEGDVTVKFTSDGYEIIE